MAEHNPFVINVRKLRLGQVEKINVMVEAEIKDIELPYARVIEGSQVCVEGFLENVSNGVLLTANATASWIGECRRCLEPASGKVLAKIKELYVDHPDPSLNFPINNSFLDVSLAAKELLLLELPVLPLCRDDCKGLCVNCGQNLNEELCSCY